MTLGEVLDVAAEAVVDFEHDEAHAYGVDHLFRQQLCISQSVGPQLSSLSYMVEGHCR